MRKRIKLRDRLLPDYYRGEEIMNMVTHIVGGAMGIAALVLCLIKAIRGGGALDIIGATVYGVSMVALYTMSSIYHGLRPGTAKKVLQIIDHCTIYLLIAGTYTPLVLSAIRPMYPLLGWGLFALEWALTTLAIVLTAIDLKKYRVFSMICYIGLGWAILPFCPQVIHAVTETGFLLLLLGGVSYTVGAILFGVGSKIHWIHSVFHIFVVIGSFLQFLTVFLFAYH